MRRRGELERRPARALFVLIGARPSTEQGCDTVVGDDKDLVLTGCDLLTDPRYATTWKHPRREPYLLETWVPGVFAAGDSRTAAMARVASAVSEGRMAIKFVPQYFGEQLF